MLVIKGRNPCPERRRVLHVWLQNPHWGGLARAAVISRSIHGIIWLLGPASHTQQNKHLPPTRAERVQAAPFFYSNDPQSVINADHPAAAAAAAVWLHSAHFRSISLSRRQLAHSAAWAPARASLSIYEYFIFSHHTRPIVLLFLFFFLLHVGLCDDPQTIKWFILWRRMWLRRCCCCCAIWCALRLRQADRVWSVRWSNLSSNRMSSWDLR